MDEERLFRHSLNQENQIVSEMVSSKDAALRRYMASAEGNAMLKQYLSIRLSGKSKFFAQELENLVQEVWVRALASKEKWQEENAMEVWLRGIAKYVFFEWCRRAKRAFEATSDPKIVDQLPDELGGAAERKEAAKKELRKVKEVWTALSPREQRALELLTEDKSYEEIAAALKETRANVKNIIFRARKKIASQLRTDTN